MSPVSRKLRSRLSWAIALAMIVSALLMGATGHAGEIGGKFAIAFAVIFIAGMWILVLLWEGD